ncbi:MAG: alpha/beta hydrolase family protein [Verrucomicrobiales bacterium]|nr:alpha/beta hydrolase family protein [Verrucomicrobiales bacterium]
MNLIRLTTLTAILISCFHSPVQADDSSSAGLKDLNGFFPFHVPDSLEQWETRADLLRRRVLVANGMFPLPEKTPLNAVVHGKVQRDGFTIEKVYFESVPGFHVTGLLFRPSGEAAKAGKTYPAVLSPHGHGGRIYDLGDKKIKEALENGGEKFAESGRNPKIARCVTLARLGCVTFIYDMIDYADNRQLPKGLGHAFREQRPDFEGKESWGIYSTQAELRLQSIFGLQTWNSIRALDFLESLPDVDPGRIGVTGGSGGGTQTIMVCAIDDRPVVGFPNGMVSSSMQGGCPCENASLLRIGTGNVELAALFAPKPQGMTAANDWTKEMLVDGKGFPELKQLYTMYGKPGNVICGDMLRFPHNYNYPTRRMMYEWFNKHLGLGHDTPIVEADFLPLTAEDHAVYNENHPRPEGGEAFERKLTRWLADQSDASLAALPKMERAELVAQAWQILVGIDDPVTVDENATWISSRRESDRTILSISAPPEITETPVVENKREYAGYTHGYNHSVFARRARQVLSRITSTQRSGNKITIEAAPGTEAFALAATAAAEPESVGQLTLDDDSFRFADLTSYRDPDFIPGAVKYGDLPGLVEAVKERGTKVSIR